MKTWNQKSKIRAIYKLAKLGKTKEEILALSPQNTPQETAKIIAYLIKWGFLTE